MQPQYKPFLAEGHKDEDSAATLIAETLGGSVVRAPEEIDIKCHTDLLWTTKKGIMCSIDKKMMKRTSRGDSAYNSDATWIELKDNAGNDGSASCQGEKLRSVGYDIADEHDYLMVETTTSYLFIQRMKLYPFVSKLIEGKTVVYDNPRKVNIPYQRAKYGHQDISVLVSFEDLEKITQFKINKPCR